MTIGRRVITAAAVLAIGTGAVAADPAPAAEPTPNYVRYDDDGHGGGRVQVGVGHFENADGVAVDLLATMHVGDVEFFRQLSDRFPAYDAVLYELVAPHGTPPTEEGVNAQQREIARDMGLENQGPHVNYRRKNFVHADLELGQIVKLQVAKHGTFKGALGDGPGLKDANRKQDVNGHTQVFADIAAAKKTTNRLERQRLMRRAYARESVFEAEPAPGQTAPPGDEVLVGARDDEVMRVLVVQVAAGKKKVAVLYGAGHMVDLERRLVAAGYALKSVDWATTWTVADDGTPTTLPAKPKPR